MRKAVVSSQGSVVSKDKKCGTCKFWWPNTPKGTISGANRRLKQGCLRNRTFHVGNKTLGCGEYKGFRPFFMVPWDGKAFIKIEADSEKDLLQKTGDMVHEIAGELIEKIMEISK